ncbi:MAG: GerAB/ArcD/ProY family transporter [Ignavibacteriales bacterium]
METGRISNRQLNFVMSLVLISSVIIFMPQIAAREVENDAWITALVATIWGIIIVAVIAALNKRFPGYTFIQYLPIILGKPLGTIVGFMYAFWFVTVGAFVLRYFGMFLNITILPETPVAVFSVTLMGLAWYAMRNGLESWVRVGEIILPIVIITILAIVFLSFNIADPRRILPIGEHSLGSILSTSLVSGSWRGEILLTAMFLPYLADSKKVSLNLIVGMVLVGLVLGATELATTAVFGGVNTGNHEFPYFSLAKVISIGTVIDRFEVLVVLTWVLGIFIKMCAFLYCSVLSTAQVFGFNNYQFLVFPVVILYIALSDNMIENVAQGTYFLSNIWAGYGLLTFEMVIPLLIWLVAVIRRKRISL